MAEFFPGEWFSPEYLKQVIALIRHWVDTGILTQTRAKALLFEWAREAGVMIERAMVIAATGIGEGV